MNNQRGQGVVEYILLLAVSISLVYTFYRSQAFKRLFGTQGQVGMMVKTETEFNYRHAFPRKSTDNYPAPPYSGPNHPSYHDGSSTRFFGARNPYP